MWFILVLLTIRPAIPRFDDPTALLFRMQSVWRLTRYIGKQISQQYRGTIRTGNGGDITAQTALFAAETNKVLIRFNSIFLILYITDVTRHACTNAKEHFNVVPLRARYSFFSRKTSEHFLLRKSRIRCPIIAICHGGETLFWRSFEVRKQFKWSRK